jgi:hypothetical protein
VNVCASGARARFVARLARAAGEEKNNSFKYLIKHIINKVVRRYQNEIERCVNLFMCVAYPIGLLQFVCCCAANVSW